MTEREVCPWWLGHLLAHPLRRVCQDPMKILRPFVTEGTTVLEPGCGMGFFTIDLARLVGPNGRVVAVDVQPRMLAGLGRRANRAGVIDRIDARLARPDGLDVEELVGRVGFCLAYALVHELADPARFFSEIHRALERGGRLLVGEPRGHVTERAFAATVDTACAAGLTLEPGPTIRLSRTAVLRRP